MCGGEECRDRNVAKEAKRKIFECSETDNIEELYGVIGDHPQVLPDIDKTQFVSTPLHEAAAHGNTAMAVEIMNLMPSFGKKLNPECLTPLHVAIERGWTQTATALVQADKQLVLVKGKHGQTPLHYAAIALIPDRCNEIEMDRLLVSLLFACPQSFHVLNNRLQTVVHVACEHRRSGAVRLLVNWMIARQSEWLLMETDEDGNTALHLAAKHGLSGEVLEQIMEEAVINKPNNNGKTPLDLASTPEALQALKRKGGRKGEDVGRELTIFDYLRLKRKVNLAELTIVNYYIFNKQITLEMRNTMLVVAVLISTATYQAVLSPPGGLYSIEADTTTTTTPHKPGTMVMDERDYSIFIPMNTLAFIVSNAIIIFLMPTRHFISIQATLLFMCGSYLQALRFISAWNKVTTVTFFLSGFAIICSFLLQLGYFLVNALHIGDVWGWRKLGMILKNYFDLLGPTKDCPNRADVSYLSQMVAQYKVLTKD